MGFRVEKNGQETWIVDDNGTHVATMNTSLGPKTMAEYAVLLATSPAIVDLALGGEQNLDLTGDSLNAALRGEDDDDGIPDDTT